MRAAWETYRETPEFGDELAFAQKAFATGDLSALTEHLAQHRVERVSRRAARTRAKRSEGNGD